MSSPENGKRELHQPNWRLDIEVDERQSTRKSGYEVPLRPLESPNQESNWDALGRALKGLFDSSRMVRLVGPNDRPLERHEFEGTPNVLQTQWRSKF